MKVNDFWIASFIMVTLTCLESARSAPEDTPQILSLEFTRKVVNVGDEVKLKCTVRNGDMHKYTFSIWKQGKNVTDGSTMWYDLGHNNEPIYQQLGYSFNTEQKGVGLDEYVMTIPNAAIETSGNYSCRIYSTNLHINVNSSRELSVRVKPTLKLFVDGVETPPGSSQRFHFSSKHNLRCIAEGGNPAAALRLSHGNQDLSSSITNDNISAPVYENAANPQYPFLARITYTRSVTIKDWIIDVTYQGAAVTCSSGVSSDVTSYESASFTATVLDGPPYFICNDTFVLPSMPGDGFDVTCVVMARPPVIDAKFGCDSNLTCWDFDGFPVNQWHPKPDTVYSGYVTPLSGDYTNILKANMTLKLRLPREALIGRKYTFKASNQLAQVIHTVTLSNTAAGIMSSTRIMSTISVTLILLRIMALLL